MKINLLANQKNMYFFKNFTHTRVKFHVIIYFYCKIYIWFAAVKKNYSEQYFSLFHELFNDYTKIT